MIVFLFFSFFLPNSRFFPTHMEACIDGAHTEKKQLKLGLVVKKKKKKTEEESKRKKSEA